MNTQPSRFQQLETAAKLTRLCCKALRKGARLYQIQRILEGRKSLGITRDKVPQFLQLVEDLMRKRPFRGEDADEKFDRRIARLWMEQYPQEAAVATAPLKSGDIMRVVRMQEEIAQQKTVAPTTTTKPFLPGLFPDVETRDYWMKRLQEPGGYAELLKVVEEHNV